ncbi:hypothetical protein D9M68_313500 [compost metagenome]
MNRDHVDKLREFELSATQRLNGLLVNIDVERDAEPAHDAASGIAGGPGGSPGPDITSRYAAESKLDVEVIPRFEATIPCRCGPLVIVRMQQLLPGRVTFVNGNVQLFRSDAERVLRKWMQVNPASARIERPAVAEYALYSSRRPQWFWLTSGIGCRNHTRLAIRHQLVDVDADAVPGLGTGFRPPILAVGLSLSVPRDLGNTRPERTRGRMSRCSSIVGVNCAQ